MKEKRGKQNMIIRLKAITKSRDTEVGTSCGEEHKEKPRTSTFISSLENYIPTN